MTLIQAVASRNNAALSAMVAAGTHPLEKFEAVIQLRHDAVGTVLQYANGECRQALERYQRHLFLINRYPEALAAIDEWLSREHRCSREFDNR